MQTPSLDEALDRITAKDPRYHREAYSFLREALDHTQRSVTKANQGQTRHVSGQELLEGIRHYALSQYGPMALTLLQEWGVTRCEDFGELVFNLVEHGLLSKTDKDSREDFANGYDFETAFRKPFQPARTLPATPVEATQE
ncbi:MAG TPA: hypothetical protein DCM86_19005 [Verrucomicrobiales bacterium]|nr:hypothetical protein [Verrucomicrobiales bacterium]